MWADVWMWEKQKLFDLTKFLIRILNLVYLSKFHTDLFLSMVM